MSRRVWVGLALIAAVGIGCTGPSREPDQPEETAPVTATTQEPMPTLPETQTPSVTPTQTKAVVTVGDGIYEVGVDIKPGTYKTVVPDDSINCYWSRLKTLDTSSIIDNGNLDSGARGLVVIKKTDAGVEFSGGCEWRKVK